MEIKIKDIERLPEAAAQFIETFLEPVEEEGARVFCFYGQMGAGKTTFISELCRQLGSEDEVSSPTFSIVNEYDTEKWGRIYHFDCYRLDSEEEAFDIGAEDYFDSGSPCFVEWPEKIESLIPENAISVYLSVDPDTGTRILKIKAVGLPNI